MGELEPTEMYALGIINKLEKSLDRAAEYSATEPSPNCPARVGGGGSFCVDCAGDFLEEAKACWKRYFLEGGE